MTDNTEIQRIIQEYYENIDNAKFNILEEMDQCLEKYNLPRLNQEDPENLNTPISTMVIEKRSSKTYQKVKIQDQMASPVNSTKHSNIEYLCSSNSSKKSNRR